MAMSTAAHEGALLGAPVRELAGQGLGLVVGLLGRFVPLRLEVLEALAHQGFEARVEGRLLEGRHGRSTGSAEEV